MKDESVTLWRVTARQGATELPEFYVPVDNRYADAYAVAQEKAFLVLTVGALTARASFVVTSTETGEAYRSEIALHPGGVMQFRSMGAWKLPGAVGL